MLADEILTGKILGCAYTVHSVLGPGLLEKTYEECLYYELKQNGFVVEKQKEIPLKYKEIWIEVGYRLDLLVENRIILELKAIENFNPVHVAQILTYLKLTGCQIGYLINFNVTSLKYGIKRYII
jgi:GxxExxY protein